MGASVVWGAIKEGPVVAPALTIACSPIVIQGVPCPVDSSYVR